MEMKKFKIGMIGTGGRSVPYAKTFMKNPQIEIVAIADPVERNRQVMMNLAGIDPKSLIQYNSGEELYDKHKDLDGVTVITPNYLHKDMAVKFLKRDIVVALEKPITTTMADAEEILEAVKHSGRLLIGFVLRSAPYYKSVKKVIDSGVLGNIVTVQADELGSYGVSSIISRSPWRRYKRFSGGSMMEKSSHDIDLLNYLIGSRPVSINSYGGSLIFKHNPALPKLCADCKLKEECQYYGKPEFSESAKDETLQRFIDASNDMCIYNIDKDVADNQSVTLEYENGVIANFMLSFNCSGPRSGRNLHIVGTRGRLWGNIDDNELFYYENSSKETTKVEIKRDLSSGHNGGDEKHVREMFKMLEDKNYQPLQNAYAGYLSNAVCIASDISVAEKRRINFRYKNDNYIDFV